MKKTSSLSESYDSIKNDVNMKTKFLLSIAALVVAGAMWAQEIYHVRLDGNDAANDGKSWSNAFATVQKALDASTSGDQIWVAAGEHKPTAKIGGSTDLLGAATSARSVVFRLKYGVKIYGGFPASGNPTMTERDWTTNVTTLSGDLSSVSAYYDAFHVVVSIGDVGDAVLDGFTLSGSNANDYLDEENGVVVDGATIYHFNGGAMIIHNSSPTLSNIIITGIASRRKGCVEITNHSSPKLTNVTLSGNRAQYGGGFFISSNSNPVMENVLIFGNSSEGEGAGIYIESSSAPEFINVTIARNSSFNLKGSFYIQNSSAVFKNTVIWSNSSGLVNSGSTLTFNYSLIQGKDLRSEGEGNLNGASPLTIFANPDLAEPLVLPTVKGDYRLSNGCVAIDAGKNEYSTQNVDVEGNPRIKNGKIDLGAYEFQSYTPDYNEADKEALRGFLRQTSANAGRVNLYYVSRAYEASNAMPDTLNWQNEELWIGKLHGIIWTESVPKRIVKIGYEAGGSFSTVWNAGSLAGSIDLSQCTEVTNVICSANRITGLDVSGCTKLKELYCNDNRITTLDVRNSLELVTLLCNSNLLSQLYVSGLSKLVRLDCWNNKTITELNMTGCSDLTDLDCSYNKITTLDLSGSPKLTDVMCVNNLINDLKLNTSSPLVNFNCSNNKLTALSLNTFTALKSLVYGGNNIPNLNLSALTALEYLDCGETNSTALDIKDARRSNILTSCFVWHLHFQRNSQYLKTQDRFYCYSGV